MGTLKRNFLLNSSYQLLLILLPLITAPYASRTLGLSGLGTYSYTYSIAIAFALTAKLGIDTYGNRSIAKCRNDKEEITRVFSEIYFLQLLFGSIILLLYILFLFLFKVDFFFIQLLQIIWIINPIIDINWYFFGLEKFQFIVFRNIIVKISSFILILLTIKQPEDLWIYVLIMGGSTCLGYAISWPFLKIKIIFNTHTFINSFKRFKVILILFLPVLAMSIFTILNKIMLGNISNITELGYYDSADKIMLAPKGIIGALGTVMLPRIVNISDDILLRNRYLKSAIFFIVVLSIAFSFGMSSVSTKFSILFFGTSFAKSGPVISILSFSLLFYGIGNVIRTQLLLPLENDKPYVISIVIGAIVNLCINLILIPFFGSLGAAVATLFSEFTIFFIQLLYVRKDLDIRFLIKEIFMFSFIGLNMFFIVKYVQSLIDELFLSFFISICIGAVFFIISSYGYMYISKDIIIVNIRKQLKIFRKGEKNK